MYEKMTVEEIRDKLVNEYGLLKSDVIAIKGKANLIARLESAKKLEDGDFLPPSPDEPSWTEYVLSRLEKDEVKEKYPTVAGLRRVTSQVMGQIIESTTEVRQVPEQSNNFRSTVVHTITVLLENPRHPKFPTVTISGAADVGVNNSVEPFSKHPTATAETKAEGRALRRLLTLNVLSAEEIEDKTGEGDAAQSERINNQQIDFLDLMCGPNKYNINVEKFVKQSHPGLESVRQLSYYDTQKLFQLINRYQAAVGIPEEIQDYQSNWKESFAQ